MTNFRAPTADDLTTRVKHFKVPYARVLDFFNQATALPLGNVFAIPRAVNLPEGYRVLSVFNDQIMRAFIFAVCHPSWPVTATDSPLIDDRLAPVEIEWRYVAMTGIECA